MHRTACSCGRRKGRAIPAQRCLPVGPIILTLFLLLVFSTRLAGAAPFRGVFFNPKVTTGDPNYLWLSFYPDHRAQIRTALRELVSEAGINLVDIFVSIPYALKNPAQTPPTDKPFQDWANLTYLDNAAAFVDDCAAAGLAVELDLVSNMWIPYSVDPRHQIALTNWLANGPGSCEIKRRAAAQSLRRAHWLPR